jgi:hypothetical protein
MKMSDQIKQKLSDHAKQLFGQKYPTLLEAREFAAQLATEFKNIGLKESDYSGYENGIKINDDNIMPKIDIHFFIKGDHKSKQLCVRISPNEANIVMKTELPPRLLGKIFDFGNPIQTQVFSWDKRDTDFLKAVATWITQHSSEATQKLVSVSTDNVVRLHRT